jgi:DnaK suppressor protein
VASKDAFLRLTSRLMQRRDALRQSLARDRDSLRASSAVDGVGDQIDAAVDAENNEICSQLVELESRELGQIEHALQGIAVGVYGRCEYCGARISAARLSALPYTNSCIACQRKEEGRGRSGRLEHDAKRWARIDDRPIEEGDHDVQIELNNLERDSHESS